MLLSVIIPVYGVEKYAEVCSRSLMEQSLQESVEFIFVDDHTPDNSINIIESVIRQYPARKNQVKILRHKENQGLPAARNTGLNAACGKYIFHCDSDDYAEPEWLERMLKTAEETCADFVWANWLLTYENTDRIMQQPAFDTAEEALKGTLNGQMKYNVWNKIVKRSLYTENEISFPAGHGMGEDMTMIKLLACAKKVSYCDYAGYHYVKTNSGAMTSNLSERSYEDICYNVESTIDFLKNKVRQDMSLLSDIFRLHTKFPLLISSDKNNYIRWSKQWPQSNRFIDLAGFSFRNRLLNHLADKHLWPLVKLHFIIYNLVYRLYFK